MPQCKKELRKTFLAYRRGLAPEQLAEWSRLAQTLLMENPIWQNAAAIGLYLPIASEMDTGLLLEAAMRAEKKVYLPRITGPGQMEFALYTSFDALEEGPHKILQPSSPKAAMSLDLLLAPGLAFDKAGFRLGFGGGYYDRFLGVKKSFAKTTVGFCCGGQIVEKLPRDMWDKPMTALCSEDGWQWI